MSYLVLARKWRPRKFSEVKGQPHAVRALTNAITAERVHHAWLFAGTRGVGKTTLARILAAALNCGKGAAPEPCGECASCASIQEGSFVDLMEVDAASRTKVEQTRELLENVQYAPTSGRYKIYLIDEAHMLSTSSFNALLKTLEEPPPHVKFLLATTEPRKLPVTVLSRCLQINLRSMDSETISGQLEAICEGEGVEAEPGALARLSRAANGSMRDALSLLDQAIAYGASTVRETDVADMLGGADQPSIIHLLNALAAGDGDALLAGARELRERLADPANILAEMAAALQRLALLQTVGAGVLDEDDDSESLAALAEALSDDQVQLLYEIAIQGRNKLPLAPDPGLGLEMTLLRMLAFQPQHAAAMATAGGGAARPAASAAGVAARSAESREDVVSRAGLSRPKGRAARPPSRGREEGAASRSKAGGVAARSEEESAASRSEAGGVASRSEAARPPSRREAGGPSSRAEAAPTVAPPAKSEPEPQPQPEPQPGSQLESQPEAEGPLPEQAPAPDGNAPLSPGAWPATVAGLGLAGLSGEIAAHSELADARGGCLRLRLDGEHENLLTEEVRDELVSALRDALPAVETVEIEIAGAGKGETLANRNREAERRRQQQAEEEFKADPFVQASLEIFDATIEVGSIKPADPAAAQPKP